VSRVKPVYRALQARLGFKVLLVFMARPELRVRQVFRVKQDFKGLRAFREYREILELRVRLVCRARQGLRLLYFPAAPHFITRLA
jgi:hypothetical protein